MGEQLTALIVSCREGLSQELQTALELAGITSELAPTCSHARERLEQPDAPQLVFSEVTLPDATFATLIGMAAGKAAPAPVIVVSEVIDYETFMDAMEAGAADFIAPPFSAIEIGWIVTSVMESRHTTYQAA
ncbi:MAG: response regulator [Acidobacteria bacterium]|nr:response regulator [Acidobacteriota bacterium]